MKRILAIIASLFIGATSPVMAEKHEASMNFDLENVRPFLRELDAKFAFGLDIEKMTNLAESLEAENENSILVQIDSGKGKGKTSMKFYVYMDDVDAPDLYFFFEQAELAQKVGEFMINWAEAREM